MPWKIFYFDGSTFSNLDGAPQDAPGLGVLAIKQVDGVLGYEILHGDGPRVIDWYWWEDRAWVSGDMAGLVQYLASPGWKKVLAGRSVHNDTFRAVMSAVINDPLS